VRGVALPAACPAYSAITFVRLHKCWRGSNCHGEVRDAGLGLCDEHREELREEERDGQA
jgi:hypothetical protein